MFMIAIKYGTSMVRRLRDEEDGLALTEYLILLGLLTAAVVGAVAIFGVNLGIQWGAWSTWLTGLTPPPDLTQVATDVQTAIDAGTTTPSP
jgi:pilus assembly protein Flp/PilA